MKMEEINRNNYEEWFIDYLDGRLSAEQEEMLRAFLVKNPDLKAELDGISGLSLEPGADALDEDLKDLLFKSGNDIPGISSVDQLCIARMEGDLSPSAIQDFDQRLSIDSGLEVRYGAFLETRLQPDPGITYPGKSGLLRKRRVMTTWILTAISSAAILVLALILWPRFQQPESQSLAGANVPETLQKEPDSNLKSGKPELPSSGTTTVIPQTTSVPDNTLASSTPAGKSVSNRRPEMKPSPEATNDPTERAYVPMTTLARNIRLTGLSIPNPESDRLLYASAFAFPGETSGGEVLTVPQYALRLFRERVLGEERAVVKKTRFSMWEVAGAGVNKINDIAGTKMKLSREYDDKGDLLAISFNSKLVDVERPVRSQSAR